MDTSDDDFWLQTTENISDQLGQPESRRRAPSQDYGFATETNAATTSNGFSSDFNSSNLVGGLYLGFGTFAAASDMMPAPSATAAHTTHTHASQLSLSQMSQHSQPSHIPQSFQQPPQSLQPLQTLQTLQTVQTVQPFQTPQPLHHLQIPQTLQTPDTPHIPQAFTMYRDASGGQMSNDASPIASNSGVSPSSSFLPSSMTVPGLAVGIPSSSLSTPALDVAPAGFSPALTTSFDNIALANAQSDNQPLMFPPDLLGSVPTDRLQGDAQQQQLLPSDIQDLGLDAFQIQMLNDPLFNTSFGPSISTPTTAHQEQQYQQLQQLQQLQQPHQQEQQHMLSAIFPQNTSGGLGVDVVAASNSPTSPGMAMPPALPGPARMPAPAVQLSPAMPPLSPMSAVSLPATSEDLFEVAMQHNRQHERNGSITNQLLGIGSYIQPFSSDNADAEANANANANAASRPTNANTHQAQQATGLSQNEFLQHIVNRPSNQFVEQPLATRLNLARPLGPPPSTSAHLHAFSQASLQQQQQQQQQLEVTLMPQLGHRSRRSIAELSDSSYLFAASPVSSSSLNPQLPPRGITMSHSAPPSVKDDPLISHVVAPHVNGVPNKMLGKYSARRPPVKRRLSGTLLVAPDARPRKRALSMRDAKLRGPKPREVPKIKEPENRSCAACYNSRKGCVRPPQSASADWKCEKCASSPLRFPKCVPSLFDRENIFVYALPQELQQSVHSHFNAEGHPLPLHDPVLIDDPVERRVRLEEEVGLKLALELLSERKTGNRDGCAAFYEGDNRIMVNQSVFRPFYQSSVVAQGIPFLHKEPHFECHEDDILVLRGICAVRALSFLTRRLEKNYMQRHVVKGSQHARNLVVFVATVLEHALAYSDDVLEAAGQRIAAATGEPSPIEKLRKMRENLVYHLAYHLRRLATSAFKGKEVEHAVSINETEVQLVPDFWVILHRSIKNAENQARMIESTAVDISTAGRGTPDKKGKGVDFGTFDTGALNSAFGRANVDADGDYDSDVKMGDVGRENLHIPTFQVLVRPPTLVRRDGDADPSVGDGAGGTGSLWTDPSAARGAAARRKAHRSPSPGRRGRQKKVEENTDDLDDADARSLVGVRLSVPDDLKGLNDSISRLELAGASMVGEAETTPDGAMAESSETAAAAAATAAAAASAMQLESSSFFAAAGQKTSPELITPAWMPQTPTQMQTGAQNEAPTQLLVVSDAVFDASTVPEVPETKFLVGSWVNGEYVAPTPSASYAIAAGSAGPADVELDEDQPELECMDMFINYSGDEPHDQATPGPSSAAGVPLPAAAAATIGDSTATATAMATTSAMPTPPTRLRRQLTKGKERVKKTAKSLFKRPFRRSSEGP